MIESILSDVVRAICPHTLVFEGNIVGLYSLRLDISCQVKVIGEIKATCLLQCLEHFDKRLIVCFYNSCSTTVNGNKHKTVTL